MPNDGRWITVGAGMLAVVCGTTAALGADTQDLAKYFGFDEPRIVVVDEGTGPALTADFDGDGLNDLAVVNNSKSRIEIYRQRKEQRTDEQMERDAKANELPPNAWFDRTEISVAHRVSGFRAFDVDRDGKLDIVYAGTPSEVVVLRQKDTMSFEDASKRRIPDLSAGQDGFEIADVMGDSDTEMLALVAGKINIYAMSGATVRGEPTVLGSSGDLVAFFVEDYNGDGLKDILGVIPDDASPMRMWLQSNTSGGGKSGQIGPEKRFEMPSLVEAEPIRFEGRAAASIGTIERASRRIVLYDVTTESVSPGSAGGGEREAVAEVYGFRGGASKERSVVVGDVNADGMLDLLATDQAGNSVVLYVQSQGIGLGDGKAFSAFKKPKTVAVGQWDDDPQLEAFILSEEEKAVGVSQFDPATGRLGFPEPIAVATPGAAPVAMNFAKLKDGPSVAVVVKDKRDHTLEVHRPAASPGGEVPAAVSVKLEGVSRPPQSILSGDFDRDGSTDLVLFTPSEPMVMVKSVDGPADGIKVLTDKTMPQFGLVQSAGPENTASLDINDDGFDELLIADQNFVRACRFDAEKGWSVIEQVTMPEASSQLVGLDVLMVNDKPMIVASDRAGKRLVMMSRGEANAWEVTERLRLSGFNVGALRVGAFAGDGQPNILCLSEESFALVRLSGERVALEEFAAYRSDEEDRYEHEMEVGDLNGDGFVDVVVLDAREQMCQIFTLSAARKLYLATEFKVFESRLFSRGDSRQFEPSAAMITDLTGDGANDLVLEVHDRYMIYPQQVK